MLHACFRTLLPQLGSQIHFKFQNGILCSQLDVSLNFSQSHENRFEGVMKPAYSEVTLTLFWKHSKLFVNRLLTVCDGMIRSFPQSMNVSEFVPRWCTGAESQTVCFCVSTGKFIMSASTDTSIHIWDLKGEVLASINTNQITNSYAAISPCGRSVPPLRHCKPSTWTIKQEEFWKCCHSPRQFLCCIVLSHWIKVDLMFFF